jgi:hypothetical protein
MNTQEDNSGKRDTPWNFLGLGIARSIEGFSCMLLCQTGIHMGVDKVLSHRKITHRAFHLLRRVYGAVRTTTARYSAKRGVRLDCMAANARLSSPAASETAGLLEACKAGGGGGGATTLAGLSPRAGRLRVKLAGSAKEETTEPVGVGWSCDRGFCVNTPSEGRAEGCARRVRARGVSEEC